MTMILYYSDIHIEIREKEGGEGWTSRYPLALGPDLRAYTGKAALLVLAGDIGRMRSRRNVSTVWLHDRPRDDPDYRDNRSRSQRAWLDRHPDYWKRYREKRAQDPSRHAKSTNLPIADQHLPPLPPGLYRRAGARWERTWVQG